MAVAGQTGTLRKRMLGSEATGRVQAKTGTLNEVNALAGFADTPKGNAITFLMIQNGLQPNGMSWVDKYAALLMSYADAPALDALGPLPSTLVGASARRIAPGHTYGDGVPEMPMFPLGSVLLPGMPLPLHVFEPRYQALVAHCLEGEPEFGVVLIERGSEVGGGDARTGVGTVARIVEASRFDDGRWAIGAVGTRRIRVERWLARRPVPPGRGRRTGPRSRERSRRSSSMSSCTGSGGCSPSPPSSGCRCRPRPSSWPTDPAVAVLQMTVATPFGPADRYDLLAAPGPVERLALLAELVDDQAELLEGRAAMGDPGDPGDLFGEGYGEDPGGL